MSRIAKLITFLGGFSTGLLLPLMNLILLEKGATLETLPLLLGAYSAAVMLFELPSGILADLLGRKTVYLIGCLLKFISLLFLSFTYYLPLLFLIMALNGVSRAFSSGSLDALFIEEAIQRHGTPFLSKVTSYLSIFNGSGLAFGGIAGGILATLLGSRSAVIIICLLVNLILFILGLLFTKESRVQRTEPIKVPSFCKIKQGVQQEINSLSNARELFYIFAGIFFGGFFLFTIETYWQPAFAAIAGGNPQNWVLGLISFFSFAAVSLSSLVTGKLLFHMPDKWANIFRLSRILFALLIVCLSLQNGMYGFILLYIFVYFCLGITSVTEDSMINRLIPDRLRSSFLSFGSLILQIGGLFSSILSSFLIRCFRIQDLWIVGAVFILTYAATGFFFLRQNHNKVCK